MDDKDKSIAELMDMMKADSDEFFGKMPKAEPHMSEYDAENEYNSDDKWEKPEESLDEIHRRESEAGRR